MIPKRQTPIHHELWGRIREARKHLRPGDVGKIAFLAGVAHQYVHDILAEKVYRLERKKHITDAIEKVAAENKLLYCNNLQDYY